jgi:hypothetical protein
MGCIRRSLYIRSTKSILDEQEARLSVNHVEEKFLSHLHCMVFGNIWGHGALSIQAVPLSHQFIIFAYSNHFWEWEACTFRRRELSPDFRTAHFPFFLVTLHTPVKRGRHRRALSLCFHYLSKYPL